jgi:NAD(P)-dependent dehydrogenase (short-subunit alcohol dehydrogenase family)
VALLEGKVILVTGGGNGIGRACALAAAQHGAKVVVNDIGSKVDGSEAGNAVPPAQAVVDEIRAAGGEACANTDSISDRAGTRRMVQQALDSFGGLHAVINPAGILRDRMFHKMEDADWDAVIDVHLNGSFNICRAAIEHFRAQQSGSFVLFTSTSGIIGQVGQANYAAAKMGIAGLSRSLAIEGASKNIRSNAIAPFAWTRMLEQVPITSEAQRIRYEKMRATMRSNQVATFCVALCADAAKDVTGQIFSVRANEIFLMSQPRIVRGLGRTDGWSAESILDGCLPAMRADMFDLSTTGDVFKSEPV